MDQRRRFQLCQKLNKIRRTKWFILWLSLSGRVLPVERCPTFRFWQTVLRGMSVVTISLTNMVTACSKHFSVRFKTSWWAMFDNVKKYMKNDQASCQTFCESPKSANQASRKRIIPIYSITIYIFGWKLASLVFTILLFRTVYGTINVYVSG